jgi:hypothetical protein
MPYKRAFFVSFLKKKGNFRELFIFGRVKKIEYDPSCGNPLIPLRLSAEWQFVMGYFFSG